MATVYHELSPETAMLEVTAFAQFVKNLGTNFPISGLAFDDGAATLDEEAFWKFRAVNYGSGNLTLDIEWYADSASTGAVKWDVQIAVITPNTDSQDVEADALATEQTVTDTHLGTTGQRIHRATVAISNLDSLAADDLVFLVLRRDTSDTGIDTMTGDAIVVLCTLSYSDS